MRIAIFILTALFLAGNAMGQTPMYAPPTMPVAPPTQPAPGVQPMPTMPVAPQNQPVPGVQPMTTMPVAPQNQPVPGVQPMTTTPVAPQTQYLLKSDFNILQGTIRQEGRSYIVQSVNGGTMFVSQEQTLAICNSMEEVYAARVAAISSEDVVSYLNLADWCIKYKMIDKAEQHLAYAKRIQGDYPYIPVIERRLALAKQQAEREMAGAGAAPDSGSNMNDPVTQINKLRSERAALEQIAKNMPGDTLRQFSTEIQPILLNSCGTANCHGSPDNSFQLIRTPQSHNITLKNLYSVLRQVDRNAPEASRLLVMSSQAHGGLDVPVFSRGRTSAYSRLVGWTYRVARPAQSMAMSNSPEYDSMFGNSAQPAPAEDALPPGQTEFYADNAPAPQQPTDPAFDGTGNGDADQEWGQHPGARRTSSPNVRRGNPDPMFYADQTPTPSDASLAAGSGTVMTLPPPPTGEPAPQYTSEFDYNGQGGSTVRTMQINGESYASPAGLPGPQNVPTPARQRLDQIETNQRLYGNPNGPVETQPDPQQLNASTQYDNSSSLTEAERNFYGMQTPANPQQTSPVAAANAPPQPQYPGTPGTNVPGASGAPQLAQQPPYPQTPNPQFQVPDAQMAPTSPAMGSNYQPAPVPTQPAPAQPAYPQTAPAQTAPAQTAPVQPAAPVRPRRTPPPSDNNPDGFDAYPRLDQLFGG